MTAHHVMPRARLEHALGYSMHAIALIFVVRSYQGVLLPCLTLALVLGSSSWCAMDAPDSYLDLGLSPRRSRSSRLGTVVSLIFVVRGK